ncbi:MAG TPA: PrsW family intramembrane metalloprotease [Nocardioides sp.]|uniref:PrsW family intramembrane metalloprotease n=1 Tax=Nocardioides sp. TaxID=35761 RepID=UPI002C96357C|nr:PrsW family intramembrane metalloprotease [Nocardioides sp.]HTW16628.1 PrsW family intramembrane metalloprotease [Nocardioides sp.]
MSTYPTDAVPGSAAAPDDLIQARAQALEESAWGERFHLVQPRNLCFWVYVVLMAIGVHHIFTSFSPVIGYYGDALAVGIVVNGVLGLVWWLWFRHIDRWEHQPFSLIVTAFLWGGVAATFAMAIQGNAAVMNLYAKLFGQEWASAWQAGLTAPFVEETSKFAGFLLLMGLSARLVRTVHDGLLLGAFIGLGFQVFEDTLYAVNAAFANFGTDPVGGAVGTAELRVATGFLSHPLYSALCCAGLVYLIGTAAQPRRVGRGIALVAAGVLAHLTWDSVVAFSNSAVATFAVMLSSALIGLGMLWYAFKTAAPAQGRYVKAILAPEVSTGVVTDEEVEALLDRKSRKSYLHGAGGHGHDRQQRVRRKHTLEAIRDLVDELVHAKGAESTEVEHARADIARLRAATS